MRAARLFAYSQQQIALFGAFIFRFKHAAFLVEIRQHHRYGNIVAFFQQLVAVKINQGISYLNGFAFLYTGGKIFTVQVHRVYPYVYQYLGAAFGILNGDGMAG